MPFTFHRLAIPEIVVIDPKVFGDSRGFFLETYKQSEFASFVDGPFVQENQSSSQRGTLRGLHFQTGPYAQGKLVRVISGEVFDVAVDIRPDSPTRGKWVSTVLSGENRRMVYVPSWCAHGFCVLSETAEVLYKTTATAHLLDAATSDLVGQYQGLYTGAATSGAMLSAPLGGIVYAAAPGLLWPLCGVVAGMGRLVEGLRAEVR